MSANIKINGNTENGIDAVKFEDASVSGQYHTFRLASIWDGAVAFGITVEASGCTYTAPETIDSNGTATINVSVMPMPGGYSIDVVVDGASYSFSPTYSGTETITLSNPTGPVAVTIQCGGGGGSN